MYYIKGKTKKEKPLPLFDKAGVKVKKKVNLEKKLDDVFSLYIRLRDSIEFGMRAFRCISCGKLKPFSQADCGHYFSRKHHATRYDELNCNAECRSCNRFTADHLDGYRDNLIRKIGEHRFMLLKAKHNNSCNLRDFEYKELIKYYNNKVKELKRSNL